MCLDGLLSLETHYLCAGCTAKISSPGPQRSVITINCPFFPFFSAYRKLHTANFYRLHLSSVIIHLIALKQELLLTAN